MNIGPNALPRHGRQTRCVRTVTRAAAVLLCAAVGSGLYACHDESVSPREVVIPPPPPPPPPPDVEAWDGYFYGTVTIVGETGPDRVDAVLTPDGAVRIAIGNTWTGVPSKGSSQFVGSFDVVDNQGFGAGFVIGQQCVLFPANRFCAAPAPARITIETAMRSRLAGRLEVSTNEGEESWPFEMQWSELLTLPETSAIEGIYREYQAEFAHDDVVSVSVDGAGLLFFQSPMSGCVGNGLLTPYPGGEFPAFEATLTIESCNGDFDILNGNYQGLGTGYPGDFYYDASLTLWLSTSSEAARRTAITMYSEA